MIRWIVRLTTLALEGEAVPPNLRRLLCVGGAGVRHSVDSFPGIVAFLFPGYLVNLSPHAMRS
jgi:hypothetical protein